MNQLVSIIVPCYNQAQYLSEALESVLQQTYNNWECIIVNDGSPDNTKEISTEWLAKDNRFKYIEIENGGVSNARNIGIEAAYGEFILPLDADDRISNDYVALALKEFNENEGLKVVYGKAEKFGDVLGIWDLKHFSLKSLALSNMIYCSALFRKVDWAKVEGYDVNLVHGLEDWEFWIALLKNGGGVKQIDKVVFYYRVKEISRNKGFDETQKKELYNYLSQKHAEFFIERIGSFMVLVANCEKEKRKLRLQTRSEKNALNILFGYVFGIKIFKL